MYNQDPAYGPQQNYGPSNGTYGPPQQQQQNYGPAPQGYGPPQQSYGPPQGYGPAAPAIVGRPTSHAVMSALFLPLSLLSGVAREYVKFWITTSAGKGVFAGWGLTLLLSVIAQSGTAGKEPSALASVSGIMGFGVFAGLIYLGVAVKPIHGPRYTPAGYAPQQNYGPPQGYAPQQNYGPAPQQQNYGPQSYGPPQQQQQNFGPAPQPQGYNGDPRGGGFDNPAPQQSGPQGDPRFDSPSNGDNRSDPWG